MKPCIIGRRNLPAVVLVGLAYALSAGIADAQVAKTKDPTAELVKRCKSATGLVITRSAEGTAFCIHDSGFFLTNEHVIRGADTVRLVLRPAAKDEEIVSARVVRADKDLDLALLKVDELADFTPLPLGTTDGLRELTEVIAAGFPFGGQLATQKGAHPAVSVNQGKISALRMKEGALHRIQFDAVVNPGNSGGPVLAKGKVVGVVVSGVRGATINYAIPVSHVHEFVSTPDVELKFPPIAYSDRFKATRFQAKATPILPTAIPFEMELIVGQRTFKMLDDKGTYYVDAPAATLERGPKMLNVAITYATGSLRGLMKDQTVRVGGTEVKLSDVKTLTLAPQPTLLLRNQKSIKGELTGFEEVTLDLGGETLKLRSSKAQVFTFAVPPPEIEVACCLIVRQQAKELARVRSSVEFHDLPGEIANRSTATDISREIEGVWLLESSESRGKAAYPYKQEQAIYIEGQKLMWVSKDGKILANSQEAELTLQADSNPMGMEIRFPGQKRWLAIYKIDGNRLIIATNCDADLRPTQFLAQQAEGGAAFVRTYKRMGN